LFFKEFGLFDKIEEKKSKLVKRLKTDKQRKKKREIRQEDRRGGIEDTRGRGREGRWLVNVH
jgi:hypothetical protein